MFDALDHPFLILALSLPLFWFAAMIGASLRAKRQALKDESREDFTFVLGATLTLLGLIIGFTFSMAVSRYEQRKNYEEDEANAIGTEYVRADLLPTADAGKVRALLRNYLDQRILHYTTRSYEERRGINSETARLQTELWSAVLAPASAQPTCVMALTLSGMNDVLNSQGYTQAAWWNRIPIGAWILLISISVFCNVLIGYAAHGKGTLILLILPITLAVSLFLISDIDSPRSGIISVRPQNLESLSDSLHAE
ncbi:MAG TPA: hypothetical protein VEI49_10570 [Terriglobales bacterium]|nr:hypothetical protein [Terriglobales bacterium]